MVPGYMDRPGKTGISQGQRHKKTGEKTMTDEHNITNKQQHRLAKESFLKPETAEQCDEMIAAKERQLFDHWRLTQGYFDRKTVELQKDIFNLRYYKENILQGEGKQGV